MAKELPRWKAERKTALLAFRELLPPEDREAMDKAWSTAKANASARRALRDSQTRQMVASALQGATSEEIAKALGVSRTTVRARLARLVIEGCAPRTWRAPQTFVSTAICDAIEALAIERGESVADMLRCLVTHAFEENAFHARRLLRAGGSR